MSKSGVRIGNELRSIFLRLYKQGKSPIEIAKILDTTRQTITNWRSIVEKRGEESLLRIKRFQGHPKKVEEETMRKLFEDRKLATNSELAQELGYSENTVGRYRRKLGYTYKKGTYTYKEANDLAKKNLQLN